MSDHSDSPRDSKRIPLVRRVQLKFDRFSGFISEYVANVSPGGIFIRTSAPEPPGQILEFEFRLGDGFELIKGRGEVVWARGSDQGPDLPAGMGVRFLQLSPGSKELIYKIVDDYIQRGGTPFDLVDVGEPSGPVPPASAPATPRPAQAAPAVPAQQTSVKPPSPVAPGPSRPAAAPAPPSVPPRPMSGARAFARASTALPRPEDPVPASPPAVPAPTFAVLHAEPRTPPPRRWLWVLLVAVVMVTLAGFLLRDDLLRWTGLADESVVVALRRPPAARPHPSRSAAAAVTSPVRPAVRPGLSPSSATSATAGGPAAPGVPATPAPLVHAAPGVPASPAPLVIAAPGAAGSPAGSIPPRLTALEKITWEPSPTGTDVILWGNGAFFPDTYHSFRLAGPLPREVIRVTGVTQPFPVSRVPVGTRELRQVRIGYHVDAGTKALHIVLDLDNRGVEVTDLQASGRQLHIHLKSK